MSKKPPKPEPGSRRKSGQFTKGVSGNPSGRPKGSVAGATMLGESIRTFLAEQDGVKNRTRLEGLILRLYDEDPKTLLAYGFGKPIETHDVSVSTVSGVPEDVLESLRAIARDGAQAPK